MTYENLTNLQKIALKGQIARLLLASIHDADLKVNIYRMLLECDKQYRGLFFEAIKESVKLDEETLNRIYFEVLNKSTPVYLWIECVIEDIKWMTNPYNTLTALSKISIDKAKEKQNMLTSMFIRFVRNVILASPDAVELLLKAIQEDTKLEFLYPSCVYLQDCLQEVKNSEFYSSDNISDEIFKYSLNMAEPLSLAEETSKLTSSFNNRKTKKSNYETPKSIIQITKIDLGNYSHELSEEMPSDFPKEELQKLIDYLIPPKEKSHEKVSYVVQKAFKNTNIKEDLRQCDTEEEAEKYIEEINEKDPDLQRTCEFKICKKIIEE